MSPRLIVSSILAICLLTGCGAWQMVSDASSSAYRSVFFKQVKVLNIDLLARQELNPDDAGRATSVAVRVYQLKERKLIDSASYEDLLKNDRAVLAQDLLGNMAAVLNPGGAASLSQPMESESRFVAVVAFFRQPDGAGDWKYVIERKKLDADKPLKLELVKQSLKLSAQAP